jgi:hypothetical protein
VIFVPPWCVPVEVKFLPAIRAVEFCSPGRFGGGCFPLVPSGLWWFVFLCFSGLFLLFRHEDSTQDIQLGERPICAMSSVMDVLAGPSLFSNFLKPDVLIFVDFR